MNITEVKKSVQICTDLIGQMEERIQPDDGITHDLFIVANHLALIVDELVKNAEQATQESKAEPTAGAYICDSCGVMAGSLTAIRHPEHGKIWVCLRCLGSENLEQYRLNPEPST